MAQKILIAGAGGYIGSIATYMFLNKGYEVVAVDNFSRGYRQPLTLLQEKFGEGNFRFYEADLTSDDVKNVFEKESQIEVVIHYAALCSVNESMQSPGLYFSNNTTGAEKLVDTAVEHGVTKLLFSSTCAVYGEARHVPIDENHPTHPTNPYGESKRMAEQIIEWYGKLKGLDYVILRYFNVTGATDDSEFGDSKKPSMHLVQNAVRGALGLEPFYLTCPVVDTPDKTPIRDYVNVVDLNRGHILALEYLLSGGKSEIFNLGTGTGNSVLEIIKEVEKQTGKEIAYDKGETRQGEYPKMIADISKAKEILGWEPEHTLAQSIESLITWYTNHPKGWEK